MHGRVGLALLALVCGFIFTGCHFTERPRTSLRQAGPPVQELDPNTVQVDVAILERPLNDSYLNDELWRSTDQNVIEVDRQAIVEDNGFRVGQVISVTPGKLAALLQSERCCINPRRRLIPSGQSATTRLGPVLPRASFAITQGDLIQQISLERGQCCVDITATLDKNRRTRLQFLPKVQHAEANLPVRVAPDFTGLVADREKANQSFPQLSWQVALAPGEFLIIGAHLGKPGSLGYQSFVDETEPNAVQRVLVVRTNRCLTGGDPDEPTLQDIARSLQSPPLAVQAALPSFRVANGR